MADNIKQVIVVNMSVPMAIGRLVAQAAHASVLNILNRGEWKNETFSLKTEDLPLTYWMKGEFTKVILKAWGKDQMLKIKQQAEGKGIYTSVMEEDGFITAIALGPAERSDLKFTEVLPLL